MAQRFKSLLSSSKELRPILTKAQALSALRCHFMSVAPPHLAKSCQVLSLNSGTLSVSVANATVAAKLRQYVPELIVILQNRGCEVNGIRVKVQVSFERIPPAPQPRKLGRKARDEIHELIQTLEDTPLKQALEKMLKTKA